MKTKLMLFALCVLAPLLVRAETTIPAMIKIDVCGAFKVLHINGVDTSRTLALANRDAIATAYGNAHDQHRIQYGLAYNQTFGLGMDVMQSIDQSIREVPGVTYSDWVRGWVYGIFPAWFPRATMTGILTAAGRWLNWRKPDPFWDYDTGLMLTETRKLGFVGMNTRLLIVGHSQGTLFANILARRLMQAPNAYLAKPQLGLMSIAAFVPTIEGTGSQWVTNANDWPVAMGRAVYSDIKGNTVTIPHTEPETYLWRGHNLINKYLADATSKSQIVAKMKTVMTGLKTGQLAATVASPTNYYNMQWFSSTDCTPTSPCGRWVWNATGTVATWLNFTSAWMQYQVPGSPTYEWRYEYASEAAAHLKAKANALTCFNLVLTQQKIRRAAGNTTWGAFIPGCWNTIWEATAFDYGGGTGGSWFIHSGDVPTPVFRTEWWATGNLIGTYASAQCRVN